MGFEPIVSSLVRATGWTLIHLLWEVAAVYLLHVFVQATMRRCTSSTRYIAACAMLLCTLVAALVTFGIVRSGRLTLDGFDINVVVNSQGRYDLPDVNSVKWWMPWLMWVRPLVPYLTLVWAAAAVLRLLPVLRSPSSMQALIDNGTLLPPSIVPRWDTLIRQLVDGRAIILLESAAVEGLATIGWLKPVILVPLGLIGDLTPRQLELVIAHELAHIGRRDYAINLAQSVLEALFFFHPCVWLLGRDIRELREGACDDLAIVATGGQRKEFGKALCSATEYAPPTTLAMGLGGSSLEARLKRLLDIQRRAPHRGLVQLVTVMIGLIGVFSVAAAAFSDETSGWRELDRLGRLNLNQAVYALFDVERQNDDFVPAFIEASRQLKTGCDTPDGGKQLQRLAEVFARGARSDVLLRTAISSFGPYSPTQSLAGKPWPVDVRLQTVDLSKYYYRRASNESDARLRQTLIRAAIIIGAQDTLDGNVLGITLMACDPGFCGKTGYNPDVQRSLQVISSQHNNRAVEQSKAIYEWVRKFDDGIYTAPPSFPDAISSTRMMIVNVLAVAKAKGTLVDELSPAPPDVDHWIFSSLMSNFSTEGARRYFAFVNDNGQPSSPDYQ